MANITGDESDSTKPKDESAASRFRVIFYSTSHTNAFTGERNIITNL